MRVPELPPQQPLWLLGTDKPSNQGTLNINPNWGNLDLQQPAWSPPPLENKGYLLHQVLPALVRYGQDHQKGIHEVIDHYVKLFENLQWRDERVVSAEKVREAYHFVIRPVVEGTVQNQDDLINYLQMLLWQTFRMGPEVGPSRAGQTVAALAIVSAYAQSAPLTELVLEVVKGLIGRVHPGSSHSHIIYLMFAVTRSSISSGERANCLERLTRAFGTDWAGVRRMLPFDLADDLPRRRSRSRQDFIPRGRPPRRQVRFAASPSPSPNPSFSDLCNPGLGRRRRQRSLSADGRRDEIRQQAYEMMRAADSMRNQAERLERMAGR